MLTLPQYINKIRICMGYLTKIIFITFEKNDIEIIIPLSEQQYEKFKELLEKFDQLEDKYEGVEVEL